MRRLITAWSDARLDEVAADTYRLTVSRLISAVLVAAVIGHGVGAPIALAWLASLLLGEGLAFLLTRRFKDGATGTPRLRLWFVLASIPINISWTTLAAVLWLHGEDALKMAAVAVWAGQVIYTQNFRHQSLPLLLLNGLTPMISLVVFPFFFFDQAGPAAATARWGLLMLVATTLNVMLQNRKAAERLDALTKGLREEREKALEAARAKSTFIAVTSHELRTPMNGLLGMAHALQRSDLDAVQREQVRLMLKSGDSLMQLLNDVLDLSLIESGKIELAPADIDLRAVVDEAVDAWRDAALAKDLAVAVRFDSEVPRGVRVDPLRLRQVLANLVSNAVKFTSQGEIRVEAFAEPVSADDWLIRLEVSDTGPGVPPEAADKIFDSFTQADQSVSRRFGGVGLGLSIARALARQMGGDLVLAPSEVGTRLVFSFTAPSATPSLAETAEEPEAEGLDQLRVLMAEDNPINQLVVRAMLEAAGVALTIVDDGEAALAAMASTRFDCVLMDINMPVMDGITALAAIRGGAAGDPAMPVIALTASAMAGDRERFLGLGFDEHLGKPVKPTALLGAIVRAVNPEPPDEDRLRGAA